MRKRRSFRGFLLAATGELVLEVGRRSERQELGREGRDRVLRYARAK